MNKNPFSIYDFLGYLFPGLIFLTILFWIFHQGNISLLGYFDFYKYIDLLKKGKDYDWLESTVFIIVASYVTGHVIAYLSSSTVEYFTNRLFSYPSHYLLHKENFTFGGMFSKYFKPFCIGSFMWRLLVLLILFPVSVFMLFLGKLLSITSFVARPLDEYVRNSITNKLNNLSTTLSLDRPDVNSDADYHRIVMHYVYLNIPNCQRKVDNYVAMYGFLRAITLIACIVFDYFLVDQVSYSYAIINKCGWDRCCVDWTSVKIFVLMAFVTNLLYMAFVKFYRRFTLENYMALLTEKDR